MKAPARAVPGETGRILAAQPLVAGEIEPLAGTPG